MFLKLKSGFFHSRTRSQNGSRLLFEARSTVIGYEDERKNMKVYVQMQRRYDENETYTI